jgi:hypothetical protein
VLLAEVQVELQTSVVQMLEDLAVLVVDGLDRTHHREIH